MGGSWYLYSVPHFVGWTPRLPVVSLLGSHRICGKCLIYNVSKLTQGLL